MELVVETNLFHNGDFMKPYGTVTMRPQRKTTTIKLKEAKTWQEVLDVPLQDEWIKTVSASPSWLDSFPARNSISDNSGYEYLVEFILNTLSKIESRVFFLIAEQDFSYRRAAEEINYSHEQTRQIYLRALKKIRIGLAKENN